MKKTTTEEILRLAAEGKSISEISAETGTKFETVQRNVLRNTIIDGGKQILGSEIKPRSSSANSSSREN